jgi:glycerate kinase
MASQTVLIVARDFAGKLDAQHVARAVGDGLRADGHLQVDPCPISGEHPDVRSLLDGLDFDTRMRAARAVVICQYRLGRETPRDSVAFEVATRARQAGVPAYAISSDAKLDLFEARILDLQVVLEADGERTLFAAASKLAAIV